MRQKTLSVLYLLRVSACLCLVGCGKSRKMRAVARFALALLAVYIITTILIASSSAQHDAVRILDRQYKGLVQSQDTAGSQARPASSTLVWPSAASCISCEAITSARQRVAPPREACSLELPLLLRMSANNPDQFVIVGNEVRTRDSPSKSCSGYELLAQVLYARQRPTLTNRTRCILQDELQLLAAQLVRSLGPDGPSDDNPPFTLLQDCDRPPCCAHSLASFAREKKLAALFAPTRTLRERPGLDELVNVYGLRPVTSAQQLLDLSLIHI